jgi:hypothetical protein
MFLKNVIYDIVQNFVIGLDLKNIKLLLTFCDHELEQAHPIKSRRAERVFA